MMSERRLLALSLDPLPLGAIKPLGWLRRQLEIQGAGLGGHVDEVWPDLGPENQWLGGRREGWERGPYFVDGLVPLAAHLDDEQLRRKAQTWIDAFLESQRSDGWIGPVQGEDARNSAHDPWPIYVVFKALQQWYQWTADERVLTAMLRFVDFLYRHLAAAPLTSWAKFRWADMVVVLHWLSETTGEELPLALSELLHEQGYDWAQHFRAFPYKKKQPVVLETHVVNQAMGIKTRGIWYRQSADPHDLEGSEEGIDVLDVFHGQAHGMFSGDEHLSGRSPTQGTELCAVVEMMYSLEQLLAVTGRAGLADRLERIAFNALPATFSPDMWSHQYDQQVNQVVCDVAERPWSNDPDANIFGLEPNFGCCTANMHQGWPKLVSHLWYQRGDEALVAAVLGPSEVTTTLAGRQIKVTCTTDYPFRDVLTYAMDVTEPCQFTLELRIPQWAAEARLELSDGTVIAGEPGTFLTVQRLWRPGEHCTLRLPMTICTERRLGGALAVHRGPLLFALKIREQWQYLRGVKPAADWQVFPLSPWNYGLLVDSEGQLAEPVITERPLGDCVFSPQGAPVVMQTAAALLPQWQLQENSAGQLPQSPLPVEGPLVRVELIPYGCTNLRIAEFPMLLGESSLVSP